MATVLGKVCTACGHERKQKDKLAYHPETFEAYCVSYYFCNENHPNSPKNILKNQGETKLIGYDEAKEKYNQWIDETHENPEKVKRIRKMVENPMTIRLNSAELAAFILNLQEEMSFSSVSDTVRFCIERMQEEHGGFKEKQEVIKQEQKKESNLQAVAATPLKLGGTMVSIPTGTTESLSDDDLFKF